MYVLAAGNTIQADASVNSSLTCTIFGMELNAGVETFKILYQGQLSTTAGVLYTAPASTQSFIKSITIVNTSDSTVTFQLYNNGTANTNAITPDYQVVRSGCAIYESDNWSFIGCRGQVLIENPTQLQDANYSSTYAETFDRNYVAEANTGALASGTLFMQAIWLTAGQVLNWISFSSASTAAGTPTNQLFGLFDLNRNLLATSVNGTSGAWAANTVKTLQLTAPYTVTTTGLYYIGIMVAATTVPSLKGSTALVASQLHGTAPILNGTSSTGLTTALPNPAAAISVTTTLVWGSVG